MKKLIALISTVAITLSFSVCTFAAEDEPATTYNKTTKEFTTTVKGVVDQATLLVVKGEELSIDGSTNNIEYIDQKTVGDTTVFNYKLMADPVVNSGDVYTVFVGGSNLSTGPFSEEIIPEEKTTAPTKFTISGTVTTAVAPVTRGTAQQNATADLEFQTRAILKSSLTATETLQIVPVDYSSKTFTFAPVDNGSYYVVIYRVGCIPRFISVTVNGDNVPLGDKPLILGDANNSSLRTIYGTITSDVVVDASDLNAIIAKSGKSVNDGANFSYKCDLNTDLATDASDLNVVISSSGKSMNNYNEGIIFN